MAGTLSEEIKKRKTAAALLDDDEEEDDDSTDTSTDDGALKAEEEIDEEAPKDEEEKPVARTEKPKNPLGDDFELIPAPAVVLPAAIPTERPKQPGPVPSTLPGPSPFQTVTQETLPAAQPQPAQPRPGQFETVTQETLPPAGPSQVDTLAQAGLRQATRDELGVSGQIGRGMLVTPETPPLTVEQQIGRGELVTPQTPEPEVRRAQLYRMPVHEQMVEPYTPPSRAELENVPPLPDQGLVRQIGRGELVTPETPPALPEVRRAYPVGEAPRAQPEGQVTVAAPVVPPVPTADFTDRVQKWRAAMQAYGFDAKVKPDGTWIGIDDSGKEVTLEQNKGLYQFGTRLSQQYGFSGEEERPNQLTDTEVRRAAAPGEAPRAQPAGQVSVPAPAGEEKGGDSGVANFFIKRGDKPIVSANDPRLTTVRVGTESWKVNKEAAPAFQGFLNELASKGAPVKSLYPDAGWAYRTIANTDKLSEHAYGGAIDVNQTLTGRNQVAQDFQKWIKDNPGTLEAVERKWNIYGGERFGDLGHFEWGGIPLKPGQPETRRASEPGKALPATNPNGDPYPERVQAVGNEDPAAFIVHHTSGRGTVDGVVSTLRERGLGVQYVMDRDGNIFNTGGPGAQNIKTGWGPKGTGLSNQNIVGMEIIANDDKDVTTAQAQSFARFMAVNYPDTPIYGHGEVNPGHKEADEGQTAKAAALAYRDKLGGGEQVTARAEPATKLPSGLYQDEDPKTFITGTATNFGFKDPNDPGVGAPKLGKINTNDPNLYGIAVPEEALRYNLGDSPAAWRKARVIIVDPKTGQRLQVPIVDLGPSAPGANADFTEGTNRFFNNSDNRSYQMKIIPNAGPDVEKDMSSFMNEQAALAKGIDTGGLAKGRQRIAPDYELQPVDPAKLADLDKANKADIEKQQGIVAKLPESDSGNVIGLYKRLDQPIEGVSDGFRQQAQAGLKTQIIGLMRQKFPEIKTDDEAWAKAQSDVGALDVGREWATKALGYAQQFTNVMQKGVAGSDQLHVNQFLDSAMPGASDADKHAYLTHLYSLPPDQQIAEIQARLPQPQTGMPSTDPQQIVSALNRLSDPNFQKRQQAELDRAKAEMQRNISDDPRLAGTGMEKVVDATAQMPAFIAAFSNPVLMPVAMAQVADQVKEQFRHDHPDWDEAKLQDESARATLVQFYGQEAANFLLLHGVGGLVQGIQSPAKRAIAQALLTAGSQPAIAAATQAGTNIVTGEPIGKGVGEAAVTGAIQGVIPGVLHGVGELGRGRIVPEVRPEVRPEERFPEPPVEERPPVTEPPIVPLTEERLPEKPPVAEERPPVAEEPDIVEEKLNKQNEDLLNRYKVEGELRPPVEVPPVPADITEGERARELGGVAGEIGQPRVEGPVGGEERPVPGRAEERGGPDVSQQLGRVPRPLEVSLSPDERAAYQPLVDDLGRYPQGTAPAKEAFSKLFEVIYQRFEPLFRAGGIKRTDNPSDYKGIAAARARPDGGLELLLRHGDFEEAARTVMDRGNDPVQYIHNVLQEELLHHSENLALRKEWNRQVNQRKQEIAQGKASTVPIEDFIDFKFRKSRELIDNLLAARDRALKRGNTALAEEITNGIHNAMQIYGEPLGAEERFKKMYSDAKAGDFKAQNRLANMVSELTRQMLQMKHGDLVEGFWKQALGKAVEWYQRAISGLKSLYARLAPGQELARTQLAKTIRGMERELATLERRARKGAGEVPTETRAAEARAITTETAKRKFSLREMIARMRLAHSLGLKSGESALLDFKETHPLAIALRREQYLKQEYGRRGQLAQLQRAFEAIPARERPRVVKEWTDYIKAEQTKQPLPAVGGDTMRLLNARKDTARGIGQLLKELDVHVKDSSGRVRPVRLIGNEYYPWRVSNDVRDIFNNRDGSRAAEFNKIVQDEIAAGNVKTREEFIDKFTHAINGEPHSNDHMSNVERARELRLPLSFYDFSPEAFLHYAGKATDRLAQIGAYGQKLSNKGKDLFDLSTDEVNKSGALSYEQKQALIHRIAGERKAAFERGGQGILDRIGETGRRGATAAFLSNWGTSFANLMSGASQNMVFGGPTSFLKTAAKFPFEWQRALRDAQDRNILRANFKDILNDYDLVTNPSWLQKLTQAGLKYGGQNITENINRVFALQQAKNILREFVRDYGVKDNPMSRERNQFILRRFGGKPDAAAAQARLSALAAERGVGPLSNEFLSNFVSDIHGNYSHAQAPAHLFDNPAGKLILQFQKWGFNTGRMANREYVMPMVRALQSGSMADKGYHVLRNIAYLAAGAGAGTATQAALNAVYKRDPRDPTLAEIGKAISEKDYGTAVTRFIKRAWGAVILSGFTGLAGNYADVFNNLIGHDPQGRLKDPMHPPAWGIIEPLMAFAKGWQGEGTPLPSETLVRDLLMRIASPVRVGYNAGMGIANSAGLHFSQADHYAAQQERNFTRSRIGMYEEQNPVLQQKAAQQGTRQVAIQMAGRGPFDPYRDRILNGLSSGHEIEVNSAIREWLERVPDDQKAAEYKRIKSTISANSPLKVGGSTSPDAAMGFLEWAKQHLPEGEARRIFALAFTYAKTALETGIEDRSKAMNQLSKLDYDKFKVVAVVPSPQKQAQAAAAGRQLVAEMARRQKVAQQLRQR